MDAIARAPLSDEVYRQVLQRIHSGDLAPGSRVRDTDLAATLGVSRTPVREALHRLTRDGALESTVGRGFRVRRLDPAEFRETGTILGARLASGAGAGDHSSSMVVLSFPCASIESGRCAL